MAAKNIVRVSARISDIISVIQNYAIKDYSGRLGFPTLVIHVDYPEQVIDGIKEPARSRKYYLTPFREYCFQISGSLSGDGDHGSTQVVDLHAVLGSIMNYSEPYRATVYYGTESIGTRSNVAFHIMKGLILEAIDQFTYRKINGNYDGYITDFNDSDADASRHLDGDVIDRFTKVCIAYLLIREGKDALLYDAGATSKQGLLDFIYHLPIYNSDTGEKTDLKPTIPMGTLEAMCEEKKFYWA
jgi:hypothetical protein